MNAISVVGQSLRYTDTLFYLLQRKQGDYANSVGSSGKSVHNLWNHNSVAELREKLAEVERHMSVHSQISGKCLEEAISKDEAYVIKHCLMSVKIYVYSMINMSSQFFCADDRTPAMVSAQIAEVMEVVDIVKERLDNCGICSDVLDKGTTNYYKNVSEMSSSFVGNDKVHEDKSLMENVKVFLKKLSLGEDLSLNKNDTSHDDFDYDTSDSDVSSTESSNDDNLLMLMALAGKALMDNITKRGGTPDERSGHLHQLEKLWSGWQIDVNDIRYMTNAINQIAMLGQGATSVVYAGFLKIDKDDGPLKELPVAVKTKLMTKETVPDVLREVFLHLMAQHHRIVTLYGMSYPSACSVPALIVVEKMTSTLDDALKVGRDSIDRVAILCDTAAALAYLHDRSIVHRDVKPANILLNEDGTQAKLADFGTSRRQSRSTTTTVGTQQAGTPFYMAPEARVKERCKTTPEMDCWAFGLLTCEVMNASGRSGFVAAHHADLHGAAATWANGIRDKKVKVVATACLKQQAKHRPEMSEVYLHLAGAVPMGELKHVQSQAVTEMGANDGADQSGKEGRSESSGKHVQQGAVKRMDADDGVGKSGNKDGRSESTRGTGESDSDTEFPSGETQKIEGRDWRRFLEVNPMNSSEDVEVSLVNETNGQLELCRAHGGGQLRGVLRVERNGSRRLIKTEGDGAIFFVLRDGYTRVLRTAFASLSIGTSVTVGPNFVRFLDCEFNLSNKGTAPWPLRSAAASRHVTITINNKWSGNYRVQRLDEAGREEPFIAIVSAGSQWTGGAPGGSVIVFRRNRPGSFWDGAFVCAVGVPTASPGFTVKFG